MHASGRPEFLPPHEGGLPRSIGLALLAHAVLVLGLSWGLKWKRDDATVAVEAELWSNTVQQAAPRPAEPPPAPPPPPAPAPTPAPPPAQREADIALEREKQRAAQEEARRQEAEKRQAAAQKKKEEEAARRKEQEKLAAEAKKKEDQAKTRRQQEDEQRVAKLREENLRRIQGLAGATGARDASGTAMRSTGPSASYAGRLSAIFQRNVVFPGGVETISGNPEAEVQVKVSPSGFILSARLIRSSGNPAWDEAAVRAIERSERIPADVDGHYEQDFPVKMRPKR
ncbi:cell envelope integrity protein TolA [Ramlibacter humi]|uniref:Cell envelope integrity protein TolA n=1 Tax=Ramlibacter humi TaxID=2530451 RepID=A0A4Z0CAP9_9BURK|nr:cell envelope integrity protein TolA [Ramlibacter humi]TFZ08737.1 cell envelope integrity protein TolA [Ramlibacter humi]